MNMSKHTPGPWAVGSKANTLHYARNIAGADGYHIASVSSREDKEIEANASLIAAAPDLLEALKEANAELEYLNDPKGFVSIRQERIMEKARAAIAKANGEQV